MSWLLDTNVLSELRKGDRCDPVLRAWVASRPSEDLFTSVLVMGEIRRGIDQIARRDPAAGAVLESWLDRLNRQFGRQILPVTAQIADRWGALNVPDPVPVVDGLLAATAFVHGLTLVTRNGRDVARTGVPWLDPGSAAS